LNTHGELEYLGGYKTIFKFIVSCLNEIAGCLQENDIKGIVLGRIYENYYETEKRSFVLAIRYFDFINAFYKVCNRSDLKWGFCDLELIERHEQIWNEF